MASTTPSFFSPIASMEANKRRSKSVKPIENPLLNKGFPPQFALGPSGARMEATPSLLPENDTARRPLTTLGVNRPRLHTVGPPPSASLSLSTVVLPAAVEASRSSQTPKKDGDITGRMAKDFTPPPPVQTPEPMRNRLAPSTSTSLSEAENTWVVAYGYSNREEYLELLQILLGFGTIIEQQSNRNWLALKYEARLSSEKALCSQPIVLSSASLCGTVRGSPQLLRRLSAQSPSEVLALRNPGPSSKSLAMTQRKLLQEEDILAEYAIESTDVNKRAPSSVCEKLMFWYFGWEQHQNSQHLHLE